MHAIDSSGHAGGQFQDTSDPKTRISAAWLNDVQNNILNVLVAGGVSAVKGQFGQLAEAITNMIATAISAAVALFRVPVGTVIFIDDDEAPNGYADAFGQEVSRTGDYAAFLAKYGTKYGAGDGVTTFNMPNYQGRFLRAWDGSGALDPGRTMGDFQACAVQELSTTVNGKGVTPTTGNTPIVGNATGASGSYPITVGSGTDTRPVNVALRACVKL